MENLFYYITIFLQGVASFLSPCVLPLIPVYLTYMTGQSIEIMISDRKAHRTLILNSLAFIFGFSLVFVLLGIVATSLGRFLQANRIIIRKISGILIMFFGLLHTGLIPIKFLSYGGGLNLAGKNTGFLSSFLIGIGVSFGWSPCIAPFLASAYIMASQADTLIMGMSLLIVYAIGLGLPFFIIALGLKYIWKYLRKLNRHMGLIKIIGGILLVIIGAMTYFNAFYFLTGL